MKIQSRAVIAHFLTFIILRVHCEQKPEGKMPEEHPGHEGTTLQMTENTDQVAIQPVLLHLLRMCY